MKKIFKYEIPVDDAPVELLPRGAQILSFAPGANPYHLFMWALVDDPDAPAEPRRFHIVGTGNPMPDFEDMVFIATVQAPPFAWHCFESPWTPEGAR